MASVLQTIVEKKHYKFVDGPLTWQDAVRLSTESLVADGSVDEDYYKQVVDNIVRFGPYMVYENEIAMPHAAERAVGVHKTAVGFMVSREVVDFGTDEDGEQKTARLFFTLAACDADEHLDNIGQLTDIFTNEPLLEALKNAKTPEDILAAEAEFPPEEEQ